MMIIVSFALLFISVLIGLLLIALGLPGILLVCAGIIGAIALHPIASLTLWTVLFLLLLSAAAELLELLVNFFGAKRFGSSSGGAWGAIIGGIAGAFLFGSIFPIIGLFAGGLIGSFVGAFSAEFLLNKDAKKSWRSGLGAFMARIVANAVKMGIAIGMAAFGLWALL
ncbi:DUF456 family protein [Elusimicrobiota bacterium]